MCSALKKPLVLSRWNGSIWAFSRSQCRFLVGCRHAIKWGSDQLNEDSLVAWFYYSLFIEKFFVTLHDRQLRCVGWKDGWCDFLLWSLWPLKAVESYWLTTSCKVVLVCCMLCSYAYELSKEFQVRKWALLHCDLWINISHLRIKAGYIST